MSTLEKEEKPDFTYNGQHKQVINIWWWGFATIVTNYDVISSYATIVSYYYNSILDYYYPVIS